MRSLTTAVGTGAASGRGDIRRDTTLLATPASAGNNITLVSSKIGAGNEAHLVAGNPINLLVANDSDYSLYDMKKKGS